MCDHSWRKIGIGCHGYAPSLLRSLFVYEMPEGHVGRHHDQYSAVPEHRRSMRDHCGGLAGPTSRQVGGRSAARVASLCYHTNIVALVTRLRIAALTYAVTQKL
jgi:hypothetical protein